MGKTKRGKLSGHRFNPLARPEKAGPSSMSVDDDAGASGAKPLSAHQQRHLERKRLQAEVASLRHQGRKISKADKVGHKSAKKAIRQQLKTAKAEAEALRNRISASVPPPAPSVAPAAFSFDLPMPEAGVSDGVWPEPGR